MSPNARVATRSTFRYAGPISALGADQLRRRHRADALITRRSISGDDAYAAAGCPEPSTASGSAPRSRSSKAIPERFIRTAKVQGHLVILVAAHSRVDG